MDYQHHDPAEYEHIPRPRDTPPHRRGSVPHTVQVLPTPTAGDEVASMSTLPFVASVGPASGRDSGWT